jgi:2-dehydro-3-deoxygluconokinase
LKGKTEADALSFGIAAACLKHSVLGDFSAASVEEVEAFARGQTTGRVQR